MTGVGTYEAMIEPGDIDTWTFTACAGDSISLELGEMVASSPLTPWLRLYGPDGSLLKAPYAAASVQVSMSLPIDGTYVVLVGDRSSGWAGTGTYRLSVNGLSDGMKLCASLALGQKVDLTGIGGPPGSTFVLWAVSDVPAPPERWAPVLTNQFDQFGVMHVRDVVDPLDPNRFFMLETP